MLDPGLEEFNFKQISSRAKVESLWSLGFRKFCSDRVGLFSLFVVVTYFLIALGVGLGLWANEWDELLNDNGYGPISGIYWLGTNFNGQDIFQRAIYSTFIAFKVGLVVATCSLSIGICLGSISGYYSNTWIDELIIWMYGCLDSIPFYLFVAAVSFALKDSDAAMYLAMVGVLWTSSCKVLRGQVIKLKNLEFVEAARAIGVKDYKIIMKHIIPNLAPLILIELSLSFVTAIKTEAILSFLGLGVKEGISWGVMLSEASAEVVAGRYHNFIAASFFMFGLVMAFNQLSDALQDALDPKKVT
ncbi:MAG: ABC transporter permease [Oligoflexales bacterium]